LGPFFQLFLLRLYQQLFLWVLLDPLDQFFPLFRMNQSRHNYQLVLLDLLVQFFLCCLYPLLYQ
jgi:hypothetical protein